MAPRGAQFNNISNNYIYIYVFLFPLLRESSKWYKNSRNFQTTVSRSADNDYFFPSTVGVLLDRLNLISSFSVYCLDVVRFSISNDVFY